MNGDHGSNERRDDDGDHMDGRGQEELSNSWWRRFGMIWRWGRGNSSAAEGGSWLNHDGHREDDSSKEKSEDNRDSNCKDDQKDGKYDSDKDKKLTTSKVRKSSPAKLLKLNCLF